MEEKPKNVLKMLVAEEHTGISTNFVDSVSEIRSVVIDPKSPTSLNCGLIHFGQLDEDNILYIFSRSNAPFLFPEFVWEIIAEQFFSFIVLVDSSASETFLQVRRLIDSLLLFATCPYLIAVHVENPETAWSAEDLRILFRIPPEIPIIPCVANDKKSVANVLIALCEQVLRDIENVEDA